MKVQVIFSKGRLVTSSLIRFLTWSRWSHVGVITDRGTVIDAYFPRVREVPLAEFKAPMKRLAVVEFEHDDPEELFAWLRQQVGKPYDWRALFGFLARRDTWNEPSAWFCSELVAAGFSRTGSPLFRSARLGRITPEDLWKINPRRTL